MKILFINTYCNGSTGNIVNDISLFLEEKNIDTVKCYGREPAKNNDWFYCGTNRLINFCSNVLTFFTGNIGSFHLTETRKLLKKIESEKPDIIHIHNLHGNYLNFKRLFKYLRHNYAGKIVFTAHDDFLYTGRCASAGCDCWKTGCTKCNFKSLYPHTLIDKSNKLFLQKKEMLNSLDACFVFPSDFMLNNSRQSPIGFRNVYRIYNGIKDDNNVLSKTNEIKSYIQKGKANILCVANPWNKDKGIDYINFLSRQLNGSCFNLIIVGVTKKTKKLFQKNSSIVLVGYLQKNDLSYLYENCDFLLVTSRRESFSLVTVESMMHGLPIISLNTGPAKNLIDEDCGVVVDQDKELLLNTIKSFSWHSYDKKTIMEKAKKFLSSKMVEAYYSLYCELLKRE